MDPLIKVRNVGKHFGPLQVLKGISLDVHPGEVLCIIGPSGSGKTTLLRCMNFLEEYDEGEILFDGVLVGYRMSSNGARLVDRSGHVARIRAQLGMVFQRFHLWPHMTTLENVIEGPVVVRGIERQEAIRLANALLLKVGLQDKADVYPSKLSGGQMQRAAIARALAI